MLTFARVRDAALGRPCENGDEDSTDTFAARETVPDHEQKQLALGYLQDAWTEARHDGVEGDCLAQTALFLALVELISTYGEEAQPVTRKTSPRASATANFRSCCRGSSRLPVLRYAWACAISAQTSGMFARYAVDGSDYRGSPANACCSADRRSSAAGGNGPF